MTCLILLISYNFADIEWSKSKKTSANLAKLGVRRYKVEQSSTILFRLKPRTSNIPEVGAEIGL